MRVRTSFPSVLFVGVMLGLSLSVAVGSVSAAGPDPNEVYVQSLSYGGSGCRQGTVAGSFSNDRTTFTLIFDAFVASMGSGIRIDEGRKNCQLNVNLHIPQGWTYSVSDFDYRGFVDLPTSGLSAEQKSIYYFQGEVSQASGVSRFVGPISRDFAVRDTLGLVSWMPCGRVVPININSQVRLFGPGSARGQVTNDSLDGKVKFILGFRWRHC